MVKKWLGIALDSRPQSLYFMYKEHESKERSVDPAASYDVSKYERPSVTVDLVIFTLVAKELHVLLIRRRQWPFAGEWALPGGFVRPDESLDEAARRKLAEETGISDIYLEQLYTFGAVARDPRTRVISVTYLALVQADRQHAIESEEASEVCWAPVASLPLPLAFDHAAIVAHAVGRLRAKLEYTTLAFQLLPTEFTLAELYETYGQLFGGTRRSTGEWADLDKRNFYRKLSEAKILFDTGRFRESKGRPAKIYRFAPENQTGEFVFRWREAK